LETQEKRPVRAFKRPKADFGESDESRADIPDTTLGSRLNPIVVSDDEGERADRSTHNRPLEASLYLHGLVWPSNLFTMTDAEFERLIEERNGLDSSTDDETSESESSYTEPSEDEPIRVDQAPEIQAAPWNQYLPFTIDWSRWGDYNPNPVPKGTILWAGLNWDGSNADIGSLWLE
jgi:hypothetical protein